MANCTKCGRPVAVTPEAAWPGNVTICRRGSRGVPIEDIDDAENECAVAASAYRRGLTRGVEIAKESATCTSWSGAIDWNDVDRAVREEMVDAD